MILQNKGTCYQIVNNLERVRLPRLDIFVIKQFQGPGDPRKIAKAFFSTRGLGMNWCAKN